MFDRRIISLGSNNRDLLKLVKTRGISLLDIENRKFYGIG